MKIGDGVTGPTMYFLEEQHRQVFYRAGSGHFVSGMGWVGPTAGLCGPPILADF